MSERTAAPLVTPDGPYIVVCGRLWRANPNLSEDERQSLVTALMAARRAVAPAWRAGDAGGEASARAAVDRAKQGVGKRGPAWCTDGTPDLDRRTARNTGYAVWYAAHGE
ncbi:hypothetical protein [Sphingomonas bacterium]|uniref:hypothetical protein n=1 Tax=Sphingomonas bacterium TaxID=1895847 RepID=UPI0020C6FDD9|nr:hypothetical protein [Sphingomonas bacterium]